MTRKSEIPFGAQFSPNQVNLPKLLQIICDNAGDRDEITKTIRDEFFVTHAQEQRWKLADNTVLALRTYSVGYTSHVAQRTSVACAYGWRKRVSSTQASKAAQGCTKLIRDD